MDIVSITNFSNGKLCGTGLWSAAERACGCGFSGFVIPAGNSWRKYSSHVCTSGILLILALHLCMCDRAFELCLMSSLSWVSLCRMMEWVHKNHLLWSLWWGIVNVFRFCFWIVRCNVEILCKFENRLPNRRGDFMCSLWCHFWLSLICNLQYQMPIQWSAISRLVVLQQLPFPNHPSIS